MDCGDGPLLPAEVARRVIMTRDVLTVMKTKLPIFCQSKSGRCVRAAVFNWLNDVGDQQQGTNILKREIKYSKSLGSAATDFDEAVAGYELKKIEGIGNGRLFVTRNSGVFLAC